MYKIYINEVETLLISLDELGSISNDIQNEAMIANYSGRVKSLLNYIDMCEKNPKIDKLIITYSNLDLLIKDFESIYEIQEAAGGLIKDENDKYLFIFRRGHWDLPKGKIEKGETKREAAIREVEEETGLKNINIGKKINITMHTFKNKSDKRIIKKSHWYEMETINQILTPQVEEDIEKAEWLTLQDFHDKCKPVYKNILDVVSSI